MITQDAFTSGKSLIGTILEKMIGISKWQKVFFVEVTLLFMTIKGKVNFTQMGRYSSSQEVRFRNMFKKLFDFTTFNSYFISNHCSDELLISFDSSFISKSGKHTPNVGYFYSGVAGTTKRGMELGCLAIIDVKQNTAYHLEAVQTPPVKRNDAETGLVKHYCKIFSERINTIKKHSKILVVDGWFNKKKFIDAMLDISLEEICRLRFDANLNYIYHGPKNIGRGRPKKYTGKVDIKKIDKRIIKSALKTEKKLYTRVWFIQ